MEKYFNDAFSIFTKYIYIHTNMRHFGDLFSDSRHFDKRVERIIDTKILVISSSLPVLEVEVRRGGVEAREIHFGRE